MSWNEINNYSSTRKQTLLAVVLWGLWVALTRNLKEWELGTSSMWKNPDSVLWNSTVAHNRWVLEMELPLQNRVAEVFLGWGVLCKWMFQPSHQFCGQKCFQFWKSTFSFVFPAITITQWLTPCWHWEEKQRWEGAWLWPVTGVCGMNLLYSCHWT